MATLLTAEELDINTERSKAKGLKYMECLVKEVGQLEQECHERHRCL